MSLGKLIGEIIGYAIGHILRIAGPELRIFMIGVIKDALSSKVEVSRPNDDLQSLLPNGVLRTDESNLHNSGYSDGATRVVAGSEGSSTR